MVAKEISNTTNLEVYKKKIFKLIAAGNISIAISQLLEMVENLAFNSTMHREVLIISARFNYQNRLLNKGVRKYDEAESSIISLLEQIFDVIEQVDHIY